MSRAERIAFVSPRFPEGPTIGGAETLLRSLATRAVADGRDATFLTTCARNHFTWENEVPAGESVVDGITVRFFPVDEDRDVGSFLRIQQAIDRRTDVSIADQKTWITNSVNSRELCEHLRSHLAEYDRVIMGPYLFGLIYAAAAISAKKAMLVPCLHDEPFAYLDVIRTVFENVGGVMFNSDPESDLACRLYELDPTVCSTVGMGMEPFDADPHAFAKHHNIEAPYLLYSGRREPLKGTPLLLDYMAAFRARTGRDIKLVLTGTGTFQMPDSLRGHVIDAGFVSEQEKHEAMAGALAFCHPSRNESFGIVLLESWLARTPALVSAWSEVLKHQCRQANGGLWFRTYPEFEEQLSLLMDNEALASVLGEAGHAYVISQFSWESVEKRLFQALDA
jgi:glycosyltransferase involved in cell wall biosynthesis